MARKELAERYVNGLLVRLYWHSDADRVALSCCDDRTGETFLTWIPKAQALDAFYHPMAYRPVPPEREAA